MSKYPNDKALGYLKPKYLGFLTLRVTAHHRVGAARDPGYVYIYI